MSIRYIFLIILVLLCSACATTSTSQPAIPADEPDAATSYIHAVENDAFSRGTRVYWVNPPRNEDLDSKD